MCGFHTLFNEYNGGGGGGGVKSNSPLIEETS